jgi:bifunctional DNA-binding transcriptional regulator/antitoxin component of YhaV-PrlF toxin-antitoxin module
MGPSSGSSTCATRVKPDFSSTRVDVGAMRLVRGAGYNARVSATSDAKVSHRGQTNVPASLRHRWGLQDGGVIGFIDLGGAALVVPGGLAAARQELRRVLAERYDDAVASLDDPDLADQ